MLWRNLVDQIRDNPLGSMENIVSICSTIIGGLIVLFSGPSLYKFIVLALVIAVIVLSIKYFSLKQRSILSDSLFVNDAPMAVIISYLKKQANRKEETYNTLKVDSATVTYNLNSAMRTVAWNLTGRNMTKKHVTKYTMSIAGVNNYTIEHSFKAYDNITKLPLRRGKPEGNDMVYFIKVDFEGEGISPNGQEGDHFDFCMSTNIRKMENAKIECYIVDPLNYSKTTKSVKVVIECSDIALADSRVELYEIRKSNFAREVIYNGVVQSFSHTIKPQNGFLYMVWIDRTNER